MQQAARLLHTSGVDPRSACAAKLPDSASCPTYLSLYFSRMRIGIPNLPWSVPWRHYRRRR